MSHPLALPTERQPMTMEQTTNRQAIQGSVTDKTPVVCTFNQTYHKHILNIVLTYKLF